MTYPLYNFDCGCTVPAKDILKYHYDPAKQRGSERPTCPTHIGAKLISKIKICACGCGVEFTAKPKDNSKYAHQCRAKMAEIRNKKWHYYHEGIDRRYQKEPVIKPGPPPSRPPADPDICPCSQIPECQGRCKDDPVCTRCDYRWDYATRQAAGM